MWGIRMTYRTKFWLFAAIAFGSSMILGVIIAKTVPSGGGADNPALVLPFLLGLVALLFIPCWLWWQKTDDLQKQGQMLSWWWGGTAGALVMLVVMSVMFGRHNDITQGGIYMFFAQFAGMAVVWIGWKLRGRGQAE